MFKEGDKVITNSGIAGSVVKTDQSNIPYFIEFDSGQSFWYRKDGTIHDDYSGRFFDYKTIHTLPNKEEEDKLVQQIHNTNKPSNIKKFASSLVVASDEEEYEVSLLNDMGYGESKDIIITNTTCGDSVSISYEMLDSVVEILQQMKQVIDDNVGRDNEQF